MSGADSNPDISPALTDAEISRFIALINVDRLRSYNFTEDEISRVIAPFATDLAILMTFMPFVSLVFAGAGLHCIYLVLKDFLALAYNGINTAVTAAQGLKDIAETYFAETYTVFRQESQAISEYPDQPPNNIKLDSIAFTKWTLLFSVTQSMYS
ncbi:hypothetical protein TSUD_219880 [Trifolium subterraneum]|uniref:Uncharacterized protein n=1 Tax=Trifolium subterraneum TaxID=3900 RepID=A0A2Z6NUY6_TRISU|nr:hypothetical protein TSUD_219880 [Trifolium subterraneum]